MSDAEKIPRHIRYAYEYGLLRQGWTIKDYIMHAAIASDGYETVVVDGVQRAGKSNLSLQVSSWGKEATLVFQLNNLTLGEYMEAMEGTPPSVYFKAQPVQPTEKQLWELVLRDVVFKSGEFVSTLEAVPDYDPLDSLVWDDINGHYTNMMFRLNPEQYAQVDAAFTVIGTKAKVIITNIPNVTRLAKNIKDNTTLEIFVGKNKKRMMKRVFRLPGLKGMNMNEFKVDIEPPSKFDIYRIPKWAWDRYEARRIEIAKDVLQALGKVTDFEEAPEGYITVYDAVINAKDRGVRWGVQSIQQLSSRGMWEKLKVNGQLYVEEKTFMRMLEAETYTPEGA